MISAGYLLHPPPQRVRGAARVPHAAPPPATATTGAAAAAATASEAACRAADADLGEKVPDFGQVQERERRNRRWRRQRRRRRGEKAREVQNPQNEPLMRRRGEERQPTLQ